MSILFYYPDIPVEPQQLLLKQMYENELVPGNSQTFKSVEKSGNNFVGLKNVFTQIFQFLSIGEKGSQISPSTTRYINDSLYLAQKMYEETFKNMLSTGGASDLNRLINEELNEIEKIYLIKNSEPPAELFKFKSKIARFGFKQEPLSLSAKEKQIQEEEKKLQIKNQKLKEQERQISQQRDLNINDVHILRGPFEQQRDTYEQEKHREMEKMIDAELSKKEVEFVKDLLRREYSVESIRRILSQQRYDENKRNAADTSQSILNQLAPTYKGSYNQRMQEYFIQNSRQKNPDSRIQVSTNRPGDPNAAGLETALTNHDFQRNKDQDRAFHGDTAEVNRQLALIYGENDKRDDNFVMEEVARKAREKVQSDNQKQGMASVISNEGLGAPITLQLAQTKKEKQDNILSELKSLLSSMPKDLIPQILTLQQNVSIEDMNNKLENAFQLALTLASDAEEEEKKNSEHVDMMIRDFTEIARDPNTSRKELEKIARDIRSMLYRAQDLKENQITSLTFLLDQISANPFFDVSVEVGEPAASTAAAAASASAAPASASAAPAAASAASAVIPKPINLSEASIPCPICGKYTTLKNYYNHSQSVYHQRALKKLRKANQPIPEAPNTEYVRDVYNL